jgi:hypothetical protein
VAFLLAEKSEPTVWLTGGIRKASAMPQAAAPGSRDVTEPAFSARTPLNARYFRHFLIYPAIITKNKTPLLTRIFRHFSLECRADCGSSRKPLTVSPRNVNDPYHLRCHPPYMATPRLPYLLRICGTMNSVRLPHLRSMLLRRTAWIIDRQGIPICTVMDYNVS